MARLKRYNTSRRRRSNRRRGSGNGKMRAARISKRQVASRGGIRL